MHPVFWNGCHLWIPFAYQLIVFFDLVRLDIVEHNGVDVFAARQDLRETSLNILVELATLGGSINKGR